MDANDFMSGLGLQTRQKLELELSIRRYQNGNVVVAQHDATDDLYVVLEGNAQAKLYSSNGKVVSYREMTKGAIFGEMSAIDQAPRSADVIAQGNLVVGKMTGPQYRAFIEANPEFMWALFRYLSLRTREMTDRIFEFSTLLVRHRLIRELLRLARVENTDFRTGCLTPMPTHFELAARISTHREAITRELSDLSKRGLVRKTADGLIIPDIEALAALADTD